MTTAAADSNGYPKTVLDWRDRSHWASQPAPCLYCSRPSQMRDEQGRPAHKLCAERAIDAAHEPAGDDPQPMEQPTQQPAQKPAHEPAQSPAQEHPSARPDTVAEPATARPTTGSATGNSQHLDTRAQTPPAALVAAVSGWEIPLPLGGRTTLPTLPVDVLPGWVGSMVAAVAEETQTPPDLAGCIALAVLSTAAGGRAVVNVRGSWTEPVNLFVVVAMPPASRKSPVFRAVTAPLLAAEKVLAEHADAAIAEAKLARRLATDQAEKTASQAARMSGGATPEALAEATSAALAVDSIEIPAKPRLLADDVTPEQAATLMSEQRGRIAVLSAEGGIFAILAGRYSGVANLDLFLKGHAGDTLIVDRRGRHERIDNAALTLGLAVQPDVIKDIAGMPGFRGKGLLGRILYSLPASNVGYRNIEPDQIPTQVAERYNRNVEELTLAMAGWDDPAVLALTPEASQLFTEHRRRTEQRLRPMLGDLAHVGDWAGKYDGAVARIAGLLHLASNVRDAWRNPIGADTITAAATLGEYFTAHALAAFDAMGADADTEDARAVLDWLKRTCPTVFTRREAHRALHRRFTKAVDMESALSLLEDHGWIKPSQTKTRTPTWHTHPHLHPNGAQPPSTAP